MKKTPLSYSTLSWLFISLITVPASTQAATIVDLDATSLPVGAVSSWTNSGTLGGTFAASGTPTVGFTSGYKRINLPGGATYFTGPVAPTAITGVNKPVTVEAWVYNPNIPGEETVIAWGRRGGGVGTNNSFNYGNDSRWGAVGHWGGEDIGWIDQDVTVGAPAANAWHYLTWTYDGVTERVYSDGVAMHFENKSLNIWATSTTGAGLPIRLGAQNNDNGSVAQFNDGINLLRLRVKDTVMTPAEIASNYTSEKAALDATIVASINSFTGNHQKFLPGESVTLTWNLTNATTASIDNGIGAVNTTSGSIVVNPTVATTYTLTAGNANGTVTQSFSVAPYVRQPVTHRWSFNESAGSTVLDSAAGTPGNGVIVGPAGGAASGDGTWNRATGQVCLGGGGSGGSAYIDLPNGILSGLSTTTIEGWVTVNGNQNWSRVFDFGTSSAGEINAPGGGFNGVDYLTLTAQVGGDQNVKRLEINNGVTVDVVDPISAGQQFHFAVVYDTVGDDLAPGVNRVRYYKNGVLMTAGTSSRPLSAIGSVNNWLGRSNWSGDNNTNGCYNELRIWGGALRQEDIAASFTAGPDAATLPPTSPPIITSYSADSRTLAPGESATLTWVISGNVTSTTIDHGVGAVTPAAGGSVVVSPTVATTYTITATNGAGSVTKAITISPMTLAHRWSFNEGTGTAVKDSVGTAHGVIRGTAGTPAAGNGLWARNGREVCLGGGDSHTAAYIDLPNGILSSLTDVTLEGWITVNSSQAWSRVYDFGNGQAGEIFAPGGDAQGTNYFLLSTQVGGDQNFTRMEVNPGAAFDSNNPVINGQKYHFAVVYDSVGNNGSPQMRYYRDGQPMGSMNLATKLSDIQDVNNWLGRSNWTGDASTDGCYDEFRMWSTPLSAGQVEEIANTPVDSLPFTPLATSEINLSTSSWSYGSPGTPSSASLTWNTTSGRAYILEKSTDLMTWTAAADAETGDSIIFTASGSSATAAAAVPVGVRTFFRARDLSPGAGTIAP